MVATIAPGPASSGVPSGTSATLLVPTCSSGLVGLAGEQLQRDQHEQQTTGALQRRQLDVQIVQQGLPGHREHHDHAQRQQHRLGAGPDPLLGRQRAGQRQEHRDHAGRVDDHQQGHEDLAEQLEIHLPQRKATVSPEPALRWPRPRSARTPPVPSGTRPARPSCAGRGSPTTRSPPARASRPGRGSAARSAGEWSSWSASSPNRPAAASSLISSSVTTRPRLVARGCANTGTPPAARTPARHRKHQDQLWVRSTGRPASSTRRPRSVVRTSPARISAWAMCGRPTEPPAA